MPSAVARNLLSEVPRRKPPACEPRGAESGPTEVVRQAFGADVVGSTLSPRAQLGYRVLVDHINRGRDPRRPYDGQVFLTDETFAAELGGVSKRQVQRIRSELLLGGWICLPRGDAGGRGNATIWYHLHPDGRDCPLSSLTPLKQRAAVVQANARRAAARQTRFGSAGEKDDHAVVLSSSRFSNDDSSVILSEVPGGSKDDTGVMVSEERMTESPRKDDKNDVKDAKSNSAYKEELIQEPFPELSSTTTADRRQELPAEFVCLMEQDLVLDNGALERIWRETHTIVPDATAEEIYSFFHDRALTVYRNRRLDNPTGLMLSTVRDWFTKRRVLERRKALHDAADEAAAHQARLTKELAELRANDQSAFEPATVEHPG